MQKHSAIRLYRTTSAHPDFQTLASEMEGELRVRDGEDHLLYAQLNVIGHLQQAVLVYVDDVPVGCGALREYDENAMELKRMYVRPAYRGRGIATLLLNALETWCGELGRKACMLETGIHQPEAIILYTKQKYQRIPNYGPYMNNAYSVCFRKELVEKAGK